MFGEEEMFYLFKDPLASLVVLLKPQITETSQDETSENDFHFQANFTFVLIQTLNFREKKTKSADFQFKGLSISLL